MWLRKMWLRKLSMWLRANKLSLNVKKSHTCEEDEAHLRISVWHLLMNLKNNYLLKIC